MANYTMADLIQDTLPRIGRLEKQSGITMYGAATSVQNIINKKLLARKSDLIVTGDLDVDIPANGYIADLPSDFLAMAEKPGVRETTQESMTGTVISYNATTGALVVNVTTISGSSQWFQWGIFSDQGELIGAGLAWITVSLGAKTFAMQPGLSFIPQQTVIMVADEVDATKPISSGVVALAALHMSIQDQYIDFSNATALIPYLGQSLAIQDSNLATLIATIGACNTDRLITVKDSAGRYASGYIGAIGTGETYGADLIPNGYFLSTVDGWNGTWITPGYSGADGAIREITHQIRNPGGSPSFISRYIPIKCEGVAVTPSTNYRFAFRYRCAAGVTYTIVNQATGDTLLTKTIVTPTSDWSDEVVDYVSIPVGCTAINIILTGIPNISGDTNHADFDNVTLKHVVSMTGVKIYSTPDLLVQNWRSQDALFNAADASGYNYDINGVSGGHVTYANFQVSLADGTAFVDFNNPGAMLIYDAFGVYMTIQYNDIGFNAADVNGYTYTIYPAVPAATAPTMGHHHLKPTYLNDDEHDDHHWWDWFGFFGEDIPCRRPSTYKVIGSKIYVRPKVSQNVNLSGRYFSTPSALSLPTDIIPWQGKFDEIFREGVIKILVNGIAIPDSDQALKAFIENGVDVTVNARMSLIPNSRRLGRGDFM